MIKMGEDLEGLPTTKLSFEFFKMRNPWRSPFNLATNLLFFLHQGAVFLQDSTCYVMTSAMKKMNDVV